MDNKINLITQKITGLTKTQLFINPEISKKHKKEIDIAINRLKGGEPLEYIINNAEFYSLDFYVNPNVLIPRNDTEIIVDKAIESIINIPKEVDKTPNITLIDIGTGSGCIAISILKNTFKINNSYVIDISEKALAVSKKNIAYYKLDKKIYQLHGNLLSNFLKNKEYELDKNVILTANLPYIKNNDHVNMDLETAKFEPNLALYGGEKTGFELYEKLIKEALKFKKIYSIKRLILFIEIGFDQKEICEIFLNNKGLKYQIFKDNSDIERCVKIEF